MVPSKLDLEKFKKQRKAEWEKAALNTLKGKSLDDIRWKVDSQNVLDPYYVEDEVKDGRQIKRTDNDWLIGEYFDCSDPGQSHPMLMNALAFGLNSPTCSGISNFEQALSGVKLAYLQPFFEDVNVDQFVNWIEKEPYDLKALQGAVLVAQEGIEADQVNDLKKLASTLPNFYNVQLYCKEDPEDYGSALGNDMLQLQKTISDLDAIGLRPKIVMTLEVGADFITQIARIRALRLLTQQLMDSSELPSDSVIIDALVQETAMDLQQGMIGASVKATAAVTGGIDRMTISCEPMNVTEDELTLRRRSRNIHHVLKMESGMHKVADPAGGSFLIEELTNRFVSRAMKGFKQ